MEQANGSDLEIIARSSEPLRASKYMVRAMLAPVAEVVDQQQLLALAEAVRGEGAAKGIVFTPYRIDAGGLGDAIGALELVDGATLRALLAEHLPNKLDALEGYRGF